MVVLGEAISQDLAFITFFLRNTLGGFSPVPPWGFLFESPASPWVWARVGGRGRTGHSEAVAAPRSVRLSQLNRPLW